MIAAFDQQVGRRGGHDFQRTAKAMGSGAETAGISGSAGRWSGLVVSLGLKGRKAVREGASGVADEYIMDIDSWWWRDHLGMHSGTARAGRNVMDDALSSIRNWSAYLESASKLLSQTTRNPH